MTTQQEVKKEKLLAAIAFCTLVLLTAYKLSEPSLTVDEATEFWYSKYLSGSHPHAPGGNMYQRILMTLQPPLYNILMYVWLKISETVFHFRYFGVLCAAAAAGGIYAVIKKLTGNYIPAVLSVAFLAFIPRIFYYWQEASEYCLLLCMQSFVVYFFVKTLTEPKTKNALLLSFTTVLALYSQYGALFTAFGCGVVLLLLALIDKQNGTARAKAAGIYTGIVLLFFIPLYHFFLKKQMAGTGEGMYLLLSTIKDVKSTVTAIPFSLADVLRYIFAAGFSQEGSTAVIVVAALSTALAVFKGSRLTKILVLTITATWIPYFMTVKSGLYAYGIFASRHCLFLVPLLYIAIVSVFWDIYAFSANMGMREFFAGVLLTCLVFCCASGLQKITEHNNGKLENVRGVVKAWYNEKAYKKDTLVYYGAEKSFSYHIKENSLYKEEMEDRITYMPWAKNKSPEFYKRYIENTWKNSIPSELYIAAAHINKDLDSLLYAFIESGFSSEVVFDDNGKLIHLIQEN